MHGQGARAGGQHPGASLSYEPFNFINLHTMHQLQCGLGLGAALGPA